MSFYNKKFRLTFIMRRRQMSSMTSFLSWHRNITNGARRALWFSGALCQVHPTKRSCKLTQILATLCGFLNIGYSMHFIFEDKKDHFSKNLDRENACLFAIFSIFMVGYTKISLKCALRTIFWSAPSTPRKWISSQKSQNGLFYAKALGTCKSAWSAPNRTAPNKIFVTEHF